MQLDIFDMINETKTITFIKRGGNYEPLYDGEIGNYRISSEFVNDEGRNFYVEFIKISYRDDTYFWCDHSIDRDRQKFVTNLKDEIYDKAHGMAWNNPEKRELFKQAKEMKNDFYNYGGIERIQGLKGYDKQNILELINKTFNCSFTELILE